MKKEITIKNTIKEMLRSNFKGITFNEWHLMRSIQNDEYVTYNYEFKAEGKKYAIKVAHDLATKEISFKMWRLFTKVAEHNIQYL